MGKGKREVSVSDGRGECVCIFFTVNLKLDALHGLMAI
jgi:hypothetical protein